MLLASFKYSWLLTLSSKKLCKTAMATYALCPRAISRGKALPWDKVHKRGGRGQGTSHTTLLAR